MEFNIEHEGAKEIQQEIIVEEQYLKIYNTITYMPININVIAKKCNIGISEAIQKLVMMEIKGYIKSLPGNEYVRL